MLFASQEKGQGLVEYAIILSLVALIVIAVVRLLVRRSAIPSAPLQVPFRNPLAGATKKPGHLTGLFCYLSSYSVHKEKSMNEDH